MATESSISKTDDRDKNIHFLSLMLEMSQLITDSININTVFNFILSSLLDDLEARAGSIMLFDKETGMLHLLAAKGIVKDLISTITIKPGEGIAGSVFKNTKPIIINEDITDTNIRYNDKISSAISVPIMLRKKPLGVLNINRLGSINPFEEKDLQFATLIANQLAILIENDRLNREKIDKIERLNVLNKNLKTAYDEQAELLNELDSSNKRLKEIQSQLVQSEKMSSIGQLAAGIAHEINNPIGFVGSNINTLAGYIDDLRKLINEYNSALIFLENLKDMNEAIELCNKIKQLKEDTDIDFMLEDFNKIIDESKEGIERVKKIVKDLKEFSHVDQSELKEFDINSGLDSTINIIWNEIKYKAVVKKGYGELPLIRCYPQQLNQVFMNILVNAAQAINEKGEIGITTNTVEGVRIEENIRSGFRVVPLTTSNPDLATTRFIEVIISDTGCGIPNEHIVKIFDPFFTTKDVGKGTGLGLSIAFGIIKNHNGYIGVKSVVGKGTIFVIYVPAIEIS